MRVKLISIFFCITLIMVMTGCRKGGIEQVEVEGMEIEIGVGTAGEGEVEGAGEAPSEEEGEKVYESGTLDPTFGSNGVVVSADTGGGVGGDDWGKSITIDESGKILVTGYSKNNAGDYDMMIWRYNEDGTLDPAFDLDGIVIDNNAAGGNGNDFGNSIIIDTSGRILVAGDSYGGNQKHYDMAVWRYNANGTPDNSFNGNGIVTHHNAGLGNGYDGGNSITIDSNGKILVAGDSGNLAGNLDMVIWRYNTNGTLDPAFDFDGIVTHNALGIGDGWGYSITTDANNKILVAGKSWNGSDYDMVIWRFNQDGTIDTTFNASGPIKGMVVSHNAAGGSGDDAGNSIVIDSNGKILVAGDSKNNTNNLDMVIWRYNTDGTIDMTFNASGPIKGIVVSHNAAGGNKGDRGFSITIDAEGRILVTGTSISAATSADMVIWRYKEDGTPDTDFGSNGIVVNAGAAGGTKEDWGNSIITDTKGRILVTGNSKNAAGDSDMVIWRYIP
ncbi:MAG: delta-60 repeat domain-containing protein [Pseudomonadota bacterium]